MRCDGRIDPGRIGGALTGHPGLCKPVRIDAMSEILSAVVRDFGCVAICSRIAESGSGRPAFLPPVVSARGADLLAAGPGARAALAAGRAESDARGLDRSLVPSDAFEELSQAAASRLSESTRIGRAVMCRRLVQWTHRSAAGAVHLSDVCVPTTRLMRRPRPCTRSRPCRTRRSGVRVELGRDRSTHPCR